VQSVSIEQLPALSVAIELKVHNVLSKDNYRSLWFSRSGEFAGQ